MTTVLDWAVRDKNSTLSPALQPRIQQMIDVLIANQALICHYSYGHVELHYKDGQVHAVIKHQLLMETPND